MEKTPKLYLFPVPLSDVGPEQVLPGSNLQLLLGIRYFVVENLRSARRFLKACHKSIIIDDLEFTELMTSILRPARSTTCSHPWPTDTA